ncbi:hypothetical protein [Streptomyces sp. NPDC054940]
MRKLQRAAVAAAMLGGLSLIANGTAVAQPMDGHGHCKSHDLNVNLLNIALANGLLGNAINGEGNAGGQVNDVGSSCGH